MADFNDKDVMIVDDDRDILTAIEDSLTEELKVKIRTTGNGNTAVEMIQEKIPDLVILDQMLPGRSGFLVMEKIRGIRKESGGKPAVIMITANPGTRHKVYAETLGVDEYLNKPFRMEKLIRAAETLLRGEKIEKKPTKK